MNLQLPEGFGSLWRLGFNNTLGNIMISTPCHIKNLNGQGQSVSALETIALDKPPYDEGWLQALIHAHPSLVPAGEVEACFENIVPVVREFALPSGYLDNFYITPDGYPVLVEVKLWKNQEARRKVIAQILEYAKDFAVLSYEDINTEIRKQTRGRTWGQNPLHEIASASAPDTLDEATFVDRVSRNLREGRFLLLILGDGVRQEMASLAQYLMHHSLRYAFGIVQISVFTMTDGSFIAVPTVLATTQTIERHVTVVNLQGEGIAVKSPSVSAPIVSETLEKTSISLEGFYEAVAEKNQRNVAFIKDLLKELTDLRIKTAIGRNGDTMMIKTTLSGVDGEQLQLVRFTSETVEFWGVPYRGWKYPSWRALSFAYLERIAALIPKATVKTQNTQADIKIENNALPIDALHGKTKQIADAMRQVIHDAEQFFVSETGGVGFTALRQMEQNNAEA